MKKVIYCSNRVSGIKSNLSKSNIWGFTCTKVNYDLLLKLWVVVFEVAYPRPWPPYGCNLTTLDFCYPVVQKVLKEVVKLEA